MTPRDLAALIARGEGQTLEFKASLSEQNEAIISLCAFAHSSGGTVLLGIKPGGAVPGVQIGANTLENLANDIARSTEPALHPMIDVVELDDKTAIALTVAQARPGELFHAFGNAYIRVGRTNQRMSSQEQRGRLLAAPYPERSDDNTRPRFDVTIQGMNRLAAEFSPEFAVKPVAGEAVGKIEWRIRGARFQMDWRQATVTNLPRTRITEHFDLTQQPGSDRAVGPDYMGFEIRFHWRGAWRAELHRWPMRITEAPTKMLVDVGEEILPPLESEAPLIEVESLPVTHDGHVQLLVKNRGATQEFVADVLEFDNIEEPQERYKLKWREDTTGSAGRTIHGGADDVLDVTMISPPESFSSDVTRRGSFRLFSVKIPTGWDVHAGKSGWQPAVEAFSAKDPYSERIVLVVRISGTSGDAVTRRVTLGFSRGAPGTVVVEDE